jgi:uncharacterized protein YraI
MMRLLSFRSRNKLNRLLVLLLAIVLVLQLLPINIAAADETPDIQELLAQGAASGTANVATNVRAGPGLGFWIVGTLNRFETVPIIGVSADGAWWQIRGAFGEGWIAASTVTASNTGGVGVIDPGPVVTVTAAQLNVRGGAGEASIIVGRATAGSQMYLLGRSGDGNWLNVRSEFGNNTWIAIRFTSLGDASAVASGTTAEGVAVTEDAAFAIVNASFLNVRSGPGPNYAIIGTVVGGENLPIIGRDAGRTWYNVQTIFGEGWVSARYVIARNEFGAAPVTTGSADTSTIVGPTAIINTGALNIRSGDTPFYSVVAVARGGDEFQIIARNADFSWVMIQTTLGTGWVSRRYILIRGDSSGLTVASAATPITVTDPTTGTSTTVTGTNLEPLAFVATGEINIRSGPNVGFDSIGTVLSTTRLPIIGQSADGRWWQVQSEFGVGWVIKRLILVEGDASNIPVVQ